MSFRFLPYHTLLVMHAWVSYILLTSLRNKLQFWFFFLSFSFVYFLPHHDGSKKEKNSFIFIIFFSSSMVLNFIVLLIFPVQQFTAKWEESKTVRELRGSRMLREAFKNCSSLRIKKSSLLLLSYVSQWERKRRQICA